METTNFKTIQVNCVCLDENNEIIRVGSSVLCSVINEKGK